MTTVAVLGATSGIAQACLRQWAERGAELTLVARDADKLAASEADLKARGANAVRTAVFDLGTAEGVAAAIDDVFGSGPVDVVLIAFGVMPEQADADSSAAAAESVLNVTGTLNVLALHWATLRLIDQGSGTAAVLGSVAGDRGRKSRYLYGAAKAMVATAANGLQHRTAGTAVNVVLVKPGPTLTPMTADLPDANKMAKADTVAADILAGIDRGTPVIYTPGKWRLIMAIVRSLPRKVFERTDF